MKKRMVSTLLMICMILLCATQNVSAAEGRAVEIAKTDVVTATGYKHSGSLEMSKLSKAQILQLLEENSLALPSQMFDVTPSCAAPYATGKVSDAAIGVAANRLNALRRIAGLPSVAVDSALNANAQYGAVLLAAPGVSFGHYPAQPSDMDAAFYEQGLSATSSSNLAAGMSFSYAIDGFMDDSDAGNVNRLGHRRWQLNPKMGKIGFGYAESSNSYYRRYTTEKVFDRSGAGCEYDFIGWPASGNFPSSLFAEHVAWSVTLNPSKYQTPVESEISVLVTRTSDGQVWGFSGNNTYASSGSGEYFNVDTGGYGVSNCIIFRPDGIMSYDGVYTVQINGVKDVNGNPVDFVYQVDFFDEADGECIELTESMFSIDTSSETYDGTEKKKIVTSSSLTENVDYVVSYANNINAGTATMYIAGVGRYTGVITKTFTIEKATRNITLAATVTNLYAGGTGATVSIVSDNGAKEFPYYDYTTSDENVAWVEYNGYVRPTNEGTTVITVSSNETENYMAGRASVTITVKVPTIKTVTSARGNITIEVDRAKVGEWVPFLVNPNEGYWLQDVSVTDAKGRLIELQTFGDCGYEFYMPESDVTIRPVFKFEIPEHDCGILDYTDVDHYEWYHWAVEYVVSEQLMAGTHNNNFEPNSKVTRAMLVQILYSKEGKPEVEESGGFSDVVSGAWYEDAVAWAQSIGIVGGYPDGTYAPNRFVSRQEMALILYGYAQKKGMDTDARGDLTVFEDSGKISSWAREALEWANGEGLISGKSATKLDPTATATRAEIAQVFMNFFS